MRRLHSVLRDVERMGRRLSSRLEGPSGKPERRETAARSRTLKPRNRLGSWSRPGILVAVGLMVALVAGIGVWAYFTSTGSGTASASVSTLSAPGSPAAAASGGGVTVTWTASTVNGATAATSYTIERYSGSGTDLGAASCSPVSSSSGTPDAFGSFSCADSPGTGTFKYQITALFRSWTATTGFTNAVSPATSSTVVATSGTPSVVGQQVTYTATATLSPGGTPTGKVEFFDNSVPIGVCGGTTGQPLSGGGTTWTATCQVTYGSVGSHNIFAEFLGDGSYPSSTSGTITQVVNKANTSTSVSSSVNPSVFGQSVTLTATVSATAPGSGTPTGTVNFKDGASTIGSCSAQTMAGGQATCSTSGLSVGTHATITAVYSGDGNFNGSTSSNFSQTVNKADTSTTVTSSLNPAMTGQSVTLTATVTATAPGSGTPTGTVNFKDGASTITGCGTQTLNGSGQATCATSFASAGSHTITAVYSGDTNYNTSTSANFSQSVNIFAGIDFVKTGPSGGTFSCSYAAITAVTCSLTGLSNSADTVAGNIRLIDAGHNAVTNTGSAISVSYILSGQASTLSPASPQSIANGSSQTPSISFKMNNGSNKTATLTATVTLNGATYTVTLTASS